MDATYWKAHSSPSSLYNAQGQTNSELSPLSMSPMYLSLSKKYLSYPLSAGNVARYKGIVYQSVSERERERERE